MAILSNLLVNGTSRLLGKLYCSDLDVSGTTSFAGVSATTLNVSGEATISGTLVLAKRTQTAATSYKAPALVVGGTSTQSHIEYSYDCIQGKANATTASPVYINCYGGKVYLSNGYNVYADNGTLVANTINADTGTFDNLNVVNTLRSNRWDLMSISQTGGSLYVSPTVKFPNSGTTLTVTKSSTALTFVITDSSITTADLAGITWTANSRVKVSGTINGVVTGTMDGTITSINTSSHALTLSVSGENWNNVVAGTYSASQFSNLSVMVYQRKVDSNDYRVGIWLNCYDMSNSSATMRIYGGTSSLPNVMLGNLTNAGLGTVNGMTPTGWGLFAQNAFLHGHIVANAGKIGGFTLGTVSMYSSSNNPATNNFYLMPTGSQSTTYDIAGSGALSNWVMTSGTTFGVTKDGKIYATAGKIGGFTLSAAYMYGNATAPAANNLFLMPAGTSSSYTVAGVATTGWTITSGTTFGVTKAGAMYSTSGKIGGWNITASSLFNGTNAMNSNTAGLYLGTDGIRNYNSSSKYVNIQNGVITAVGANISGVLSAGANSTIGPWTITDSSIYKTNATWGNATAGAAYFGNSGISITDQFTVSATGDITAKSGSIGGWTIDWGSMRVDSGEYRLHIVSDPNNQDFLVVAHHTNGLDQPATEWPFWVHKDGTMHATKGDIGGWTIEASRLYNGNAILQHDMIAVESSDYTKGAKIYPDHLFIGGTTSDAANGRFRLVTETGTPYIEVALVAGAQSDAISWGFMPDASFWSNGEINANEGMNCRGYDGGRRRVVCSGGGDGGRVGYIFTGTSNAFSVCGQFGTADSTYVTRKVTMTTSDVRLKENISNTNEKGLGLLNNVRLVSFDWKDTHEHKSIGIIADELEQLNPELVAGGGYDEDGNMDIKAIDTLQLLSYTIKAIQEQQAEIETLKKQLISMQQK